MLVAPAASASLTAGGGTKAAIVTIGFAAVFALTAAGLLVPATVRPALMLAVVAAVALWVTAEHFGGILSGSATDPGTGPLLVLIAVAFWPARTRQAEAYPLSKGGSSVFRAARYHRGVPSA